MNERDRKSALLENTFLIFSIIIPLIVFSLLVQIWNLDLRVPYFGGHGDGMSVINVVNSVLNGEKVFWGEGILNWLFIIVVASQTKSAGFAYNIYVLVGFSLVSLCSYIATRKMGMDRLIALFVGLLYTFIPYHFMRAMQLNLFNYSYIPLSAFVFIEICASKHLNKIKIFILFTVIGLQSLYYSAFIFLLLVFTIFVFEKNKENFKLVLLSAMALSLGILLAYILPYMFEMSHLIRNGIDIIKAMGDVLDKKNQLTISAVGASRTVLELNDYGLRMWTLFAPVLYHRIPLFSSFSYQLYNDTYIHFDAYMTSLGIVGMSGLLISFASIFNRKASKEIKACGGYNIFIILLSMTNGFCLYIGVYFTTAIRCYNRTIVFIAFFSLVSIGFVLQQLINKQNENRMRKKCCYCLVLFLIVFGILDQTPSYLSKYCEIDENRPHDLLQTYEEYAEDYYAKYNMK